MAIPVDETLDCIGLYCPMPILKIRDAIKQLSAGQTIALLSDDPASDADLRSWSARTGHDLLEVERDGAVFRFVVRKTR